MNKPIAPSIDVIIPVYNAPLLTKRCIDSVIIHLAQTIRTIYIQDDESGNETREMLDSLPYKQVNIFHSPKNQGFGKSVNEAVARSDADFVLVLNSDTEVYENFLPLLCRALAIDPKLAAISPAHNNFAKHTLERYIRQPGDYIATYRFKGHAFLIRRATFISIGRFDLAFGRGYFEDTDLGRRLDQQGWRMGVHPNTYIHHEGGASYGRGQSYQSLIEHNRALYLSRYPDASCNILLIFCASWCRRNIRGCANNKKTINRPDCRANGCVWKCRRSNLFIDLFFNGCHYIVYCDLCQLFCGFCITTGLFR